MAEKQQGGLTRRDFVITGAVSAAVIGVGAIGYQVNRADGRVYLRPPGAGSEEDFRSHCDRCQRCVQACPYSLIQPIPVSVDLSATGTPQVSFHAGYCDYCMKCMDVCPTGALSDAAPTSENMGVAVVVRDSCVAWDWMGCTECVDNCPIEDALYLDDQKVPWVNPDLCNGCGKCEQVCPASALRAYDDSKLEHGIYVVSRSSAAAHAKQPLHTEEFLGLRNAPWHGEEVDHA